MSFQTIFGSDAQRTLLSKGASAYHLFRDKPGYTYYGRTVGITCLQDVPFENVIALARLQGNSTCGRLTKEEAKTVIPAAEAVGLTANTFALWSSTPNCLANAQQILASRHLPDDLVLEWLTPETPNNKRQSLADLTLSVGVLPPDLSVLTGETKPGVCAMVSDAHGNVVSCAATAEYTNTDVIGKKAPAWWGMLATHKDQRARGLSLYLGATVMIEMANRYGHTEFFTGVTPGNAPSEAVCKRMALVEEGALILAAVDASVLPGGRLTK